MQKVIIVATVLFLAIASAYSIGGEVVEDEFGQQYYLLPLDGGVAAHQRVRRQLSAGIGSEGIDLSGKGTLLNTADHKLDGTAFVSKPFGHNTPITAGGKLDYSHKPTGSGVSVLGQHTPNWGTDLKAQANYNFFKSRDGRTTGALTGEYGRHYGGPIGTQKPNFATFINFSHNF